ncbi:MAG: hypothetical protein L0J76_04110 [Tetragenococcus halophilus]|nr:hypothetical protein [Tetragenococcus halophilus]
MEKTELKILDDIEIRYVQKSDDELLTRKELCERILNCNVETAEKYYLNQDNFPFMYRGNQKIYPKRAVEEWIQNNTHYSD